MKFNYKLHRLCGPTYGCPASTTASTSSSRGANVIYTSDGNTLLSPTSNRVQCIDLLSHSVRTLPFECRSNIRHIALSPLNDSLLLVVDVNNYALLVNYHRGVVLHRFRFKRGRTDNASTGAKVRTIRFSPCGSYFAVGIGKFIQVWYTPTVRREFAPFVLHRTYTGLSDDVTSIEWSADGTVFMGSSRDTTARIWTLHTTKHFVPITLSGHKSMVVGAYFEDDASNNGRIEKVYTISEDGALVTWKTTYEHDEKNTKPQNETMDSNGITTNALSFFTGGADPTVFHGTVTDDDTIDQTQAKKLVNATFSVQSRHYFHQDSARVTTTSYSAKHKLLVLGFSTGLFGLYELPSVSNVHTLSISNQPIQTCSINPTGEWLAFGCSSTQQLLIWEWRSETHVLKQKSHAYGMRCMAYSTDGIVVGTGGEDGTVKLWNVRGGFCYVTLADAHAAPVTGMAFANPSVVLSCGLDGTVKAHDLHRYRTFRVYTTPQPVQFVSLAVDPSGEIVTAGSTDPFNVYVWNLQSGKLLDVLTGHAGPVCALAFHPIRGTLASGSWDGTVKMWDLYKKDVAMEGMSHNADVVCVAFRPDGMELCTGTIGGVLSFWDVENATLKFEIDGRKDIVGGRKINDRMTSNNNAASRYFTSVCYSADGLCVLAGGNSKYVCIYEVSQQILLKKFQVTFNRSLDGVLDELNSKNLGDGGPIDDENDSADETDYNALRLPGAKRGDGGSRKSRVEVLTHQVAFSSTGREWATVSGEGLHVYSLDDDMIFDPITLTEAVTPGAVQSNLQSGEYGTALIMSLHLNEFALVKEVIESTPYGSIPHVVRTVGPEHLERLLQFVSKCMVDSPHVEFYLQWCLDLLQTHGMHMEKNRGRFMRAFRAMHKSVQTRHDDLVTICDHNRYTLDFVQDQAKLNLNQS